MADNMARARAKAHDPQYRWTKGDDGKDVMPEAWAHYLEWLVNPLRVPETETDYAESVGIATRTLRRWKEDPRFRAEWRARGQEANVSPDRIQAVTDNLWRQAANDSGAAAVRAAELYLRYVELYLPTEKRVVQDDSIDKLSDDELAKLAGYA
jgi:hypothetical protein